MSRAGRDCDDEVNENAVLLRYIAACFLSRSQILQQQFLIAAAETRAYAHMRDNCSGDARAQRHGWDVATGAVIHEHFLAW